MGRLLAFGRDSCRMVERKARPYHTASPHRTHRSRGVVYECGLLVLLVVYAAKRRAVTPGDGFQNGRTDYLSCIHPKRFLNSLGSDNVATALYQLGRVHV